MISRDYRDGDEYKIRELFSTVFGKTMTVEMWRWKYLDNPFGRAIIKLMFDGEKLIGHYAVLPVMVQVGGKPIKACLSVDTMIHPDYRKQGIFVDLANKTYEAAAREGTKFVYGFPNSNSYHGFMKCLNWIGFGNMTVWQKDIKDGSPNSVRQIERFQDDSLWEKVKQDYQVIVLRTKEFLNWRFVLNPAVNYTKFLFLDDDEILGYSVLKIYQTSTETKSHIVDMLTVNDVRVVTELLRSAYRYSTDRGIDNLSCWCQGSPLLGEILKREGFTQNEMGRTYIGVSVLGNTLRTIEQFSMWHLSMGDSDVF